MLVAIVTLLPALASGQSKAVKLVTLDLPVPDSPAVAILGLSPESIVRPGTPRDLATTVLNGIDRHGNLQNGLAIDFAPRFLFGGSSLTYRDYVDRKGTRLFARTQLSVATAKGSSDADKSQRAAFGIRATLWHKGDPRLDEALVKCLDAITVAAPPTVVLDPAQREAWEKVQTAGRREAVLKCQTDSKARNWNASSFAVGLAPSWHSPSGESDDFTYAGAALWGSLALGISTSARTVGQFIVQGRYRNKELVPNKNVKGTFFEQDSAGLGLRLLLGTADRAAVVESEFVRQSPEGADDSTSFRLSGGGQIKLATGVWLSVAVGGTSGGNTAEQRGGFVLSSFKWALSRDPAVNLPAQ
jgi:hypothetical protein